MSDPTGAGPNIPGDSPEPGPHGDFQMRIARDGAWFHQGSPIKRIRLARLFSTVLRREDDGFHWLVTPFERGRIEVEDSAFVAVEMLREGDGEDGILTFRTNLDHTVSADADHPIAMEVSPFTGELTPYVKMERGLSARLARPVYYDLAGLIVPAPDGGAGMGVWSGGAFFALFDGDGEAE